jgi:hypothetical protein
MADLQKILSALNTALGVLKTVAETPGVNMLPYASTVSSAVRAIQAGVSAGANVMPFVDALAATFTQDKVPTEAELAALDAKIEELEAKVNAPLPEKEADEPE